MREKVTYELYIDGALAARGGIGTVAEALGTSVSTARHYLIEGRRPQWAELRRLPTLFERLGELRTAEEWADALNVSVSAVRSAASRGGNVRSARIRRHAYEEFSLPSAEIDAMVREARAKRRKHG